MAAPSGRSLVGNLLDSCAVSVHHRLYHIIFGSVRSLSLQLAERAGWCFPQTARRVSRGSSAALPERYREPDVAAESC